MTKNLDSEVSKFMDIKNDINPMVTTFKSLSTAVPLTAASTIIMINQPYRTYIKDQAIGRIYRIGADTKLFIYELYLDTGNEANLSTRSLDILNWYKDITDQILDIGVDMNTISLECAELDIPLEKPAARQVFDW